MGRHASAILDTTDPRARSELTAGQLVYCGRADGWLRVSGLEPSLSASPRGALSPARGPVLLPVGRYQFDETGPQRARDGVGSVAGPELCVAVREVRFDGLPGHEQLPRDLMDLQPRRGQA